MCVYLAWCKEYTSVYIRHSACVCACVWCSQRHWKCWGVQQGYFWISDIVSMAADASQRKALRYQQTLVGVFQFTFTCLSVCLFPFVLSHFTCCFFIPPVYLFTLSSAAILRCLHSFALALVCVPQQHPLTLFSSTAFQFSYFIVTSHQLPCPRIKSILFISVPSYFLCNIFAT